MKLVTIFAAFGLALCTVHSVIADPQTAEFLSRIGHDAFQQVEAIARSAGYPILNLELSFNAQLLQSVADVGVRGNVWKFLSLADQFGEQLLSFIYQQFGEAQSQIASIGNATGEAAIQALGQCARTPYVHNEIYHMKKVFNDGVVKAYNVISTNLSKFKTIHEKASDATRRLHLKSLQDSECNARIYQQQFHLAEAKACDDRVALLIACGQEILDILRDVAANSFEDQRFFGSIYGLPRNCQGGC